MSRPEPEPVPRRHVVIVGVLFEGSLGLLAVLAGRWVGRDPLEGIAWNARGIAAGVAATVPLLLFLAVCLRSRWGPLARLRAFLDEVARPVLADCTVADLAALAAAAGIGEELLFRGLIQAGLTARLGPAAGLAVASLLFGVAHPITAIYVVVAGLMGVYFGAIWMASGNLLAPIVAHGLYDLAALVWFVKVRGRRGGGSNDPGIDP